MKYPNVITERTAAEWREFLETAIQDVDWEMPVSEKEQTLIDKIRSIRFPGLGTFQDHHLESLRIFRIGGDLIALTPNRYVVDAMYNRPKGVVQDILDGKRKKKLTVEAI